MYGLTKTESANDIHAQTTESIVKICSLGDLALFSESCTQGPCLLENYVLCSIDGGLRERTIKNVFPSFILRVCQEAKAGPILAKTSVKA